MNKVGTTLVALCILSLFGLFLLPSGASARAPSISNRLSSPALVPAAQATPQPGMMEQKPGEAMSGEKVGDATMMGGDKSVPGVPSTGVLADTTPEAGMMPKGDTMMQGNLPSTGSADNSSLLLVLVASCLLLLSGVAVLRTRSVKP